MDFVDQGTFVRAWAVQPQRFAWLLGAGASASAGLRTANQVRDDLLLRVYAERHGLVRQNLNANDPNVRSALTSYFDGRNSMVLFGSADDYSCAFKLALPDESARHSYLQGILKGCSPSYGQRIFGALMTAGFIDIATTTNFDDLIEQAAAESYSAVNDVGDPRRLNVAALNSVDRARHILSSENHPLLVKLHGDFRESSLKNLTDELVAQDQVLRQSVQDVSRNVGLAVVGYSGRDESVMEMLESATLPDSAWPAGLWWFAREPDRVPDRVRRLLEAATERGVSSYLVALETFDELMASLVLQAELTEGARTYINGLQPASRVAAASPPEEGKRSYPIIRYNALPLLAAPTSVLHAPLSGVDNEEFRRRAKEAEWRGVAVHAGGSAWGWGDSEQFERIVGTAPEVVDIDLTGGIPEPGLQGLLVQGLAKSIASWLPARARMTRHDALVLLHEWEDLSEPRKHALRRFKKAYDGQVTGHLGEGRGLNRRGEQRAWAEAARVHVEWRWGVPWMIFVPFTWVERLERDEDHEMMVVDPAADWRRERWVQRKQNETWAGIIDVWATSIAPHRKDVSLRLPRACVPDTFGGFTLGAFSAHSWRSA
ncbi:SIR2 family protein [Nocardioides marmoriginsengisoli]|uniref:SIR2 family protein n=1 Tax=Nocardioides marmoriginsengisoli TaxID=661483 RepID=A0A3N0CGV9_9ACTN|nr:SIR2 family protein [Nocardioides marmoriginsengisoli]RNL62694.1 SIR2 family protein [Nocardioides marmoriginsengisoli]